MPKAVIIETIFPDRDVDKATTILHTTIYQLRKGLERFGHSNGIKFFNESYQLDITIMSDVEELNKIINLKKCNDEDIIELLKIYRGDLLEEGYHWAMEVQQRYRSLVLKILERYAKNQIENNILNLTLKVSLDKAYEMDPYNENVAEMIIHYYGKQNNKSSMEIFFNDYSERLKEEMNLEPMESIINIYEEYMRKS